MNLHKLLLQRASAGKPVRVGLIGAGKFGSMYLSRRGAPPGIHVRRSPTCTRIARARRCARVGWPAQQLRAGNFDDARATAAPSSPTTPPR